MPDDALEEQQDNVIPEAPLGLVIDTPEAIGFVPASERPSTRPQPPRERTRLFITKALTVIFATMIAMFLIRIFFFPEPLSTASLDSFKTILSVVAGIYATIIGFYFASPD